MSETNGNAKMQVIIGWTTVAFLFFAACAKALIDPMHIETKDIQNQVNENKRIYEKNHDELDIRLQREFHDINSLTDQKVDSLDIRLQKEIQAVKEILNQKIDSTKEGFKR